MAQFHFVPRESFQTQLSQFMTPNHYYNGGTALNDGATIWSFSDSPFILALLLVMIILLLVVFIKSSWTLLPALLITFFGAGYYTKFAMDR